MNSYKNKDYIDLIEIALSVWAHRLLLISLAVVFAIAAIIRVEFFTEDKYVASGMLYISNRESLEEGKAISQSDINTAKSMSATYRVILNTRTFYEQVSKELDGEVSWLQIRGMTSMSAVDDTEVMRISVTANDPLLAARVADKIVTMAPETLSDVFENGLIEIVDNVTPPMAPQSKGTTKQGVMGAMLGVALGGVIVVIKALFDTTIHKGEDVQKRYNVSILGEIAQ